MSRFQQHQHAWITTWMSGIALAAPVLLSGCALLGPRGCTDIGWFEGLSIQLEGTSSRRLRSGHYAISMVGDGVSFATELDLADGANACSSSACSMSAKAADGRVLDFRVSPSLDQMFVWMSYTSGGGPSEVGIHVSWQGSEVGSAAFRPQYQQEEINGSGCGVATTATAELKLNQPAGIPDDAGVRDGG